MTKTVVTTANITEVLNHLCKCGTLIFDTETTGLSSFHGCGIFSLAVSDLGGNAYYFNFKAYKNLPADHVLPIHAIAPLFEGSRDWVAHNAKFDLHMMKKAGFDLKGQIFDTAVLGRIYENHWQFRGGYSLDASSKRWLSVEKDDAPKIWMDEHDAFEVSQGPDGRSFKNYRFDLVPFEIISDYAMQDAIVTGELYEFLHANMYANDILMTEVSLTPVLYEMEQRGIQLDKEYCNQAYAFESARADKIQNHIKESFPAFVDSAEFISPALKELGVELPQTEKGNDQTSEKALAPHASIPLVASIIEFRDATKRAQTYWYGYQNLADKESVVHPNFNQGGTTTGRMSCSNPNLQNIPSDDNGPFPVRRAFIARDGFKLVSIDYAQMEFRLMLEYAREKELIERIKAGHDPHDSTAEMTGLTRKAAKTLNFGLLYGMGIAKLAEAIGVSPEDAKNFKYEYFAALPGVRYFIREASRRMEQRGFALNLYNRRFYLEDKKWSYKAANCIIQGGCADIVKRAMVALAPVLEHKKSKMLLQIHDEIVFEIHESEMHLIPQLKKIMEDAYVAKEMPMQCSVTVGPNLHDQGDWNEKDVSA